MKIRVVSLMFGFFFTANAFAVNNVEDVLTRFFSNLNTISADFEQVVQKSQLISVAQASGKLWIQRPGKFRWDYLSPYEQEIVSDGEKLWIFDKDLEQVTVRSVSGTLENTPAALLSDSKPLSDTFRIKMIGKKILLNWVELTPKDEEASFTAIRLGFDGDVLAEMLLEDNLGQTTQIKFQNLKRNVKINNDLFDFVPPAGVDVFKTSE